MHSQAGRGVLLTCRNKIRTVEMPEYRYPTNENENSGPADYITIIP